MAHSIAFCEYDDCEVSADIADMEELSDDDGVPIYVCMSCYERMEDSSGYCSISCQLGYGCDQSC
jgi:hypothetical protein